MFTFLQYKRQINFFLVRSSDLCFTSCISMFPTLLQAFDTRQWSSIQHLCCCSGWPSLFCLQTYPLPQTQYAFHCTEFPVTNSKKMENAKNKKNCVLNGAKWKLSLSLKNDSNSGDMKWCLLCFRVYKTGQLFSVPSCTAPHNKRSRAPSCLPELAMCRWIRLHAAVRTGEDTVHGSAC